MGKAKFVERDLSEFEKAENELSGKGVEESLYREAIEAAKDAKREARLAREEAKSLRKTKTVRKDPRVRHIDGTPNYVKITNKRKDRHYTLVYMNSPMALAYYETAGFEPVIYNPKDPHSERISGGASTCKEGEPLQVVGHQLMSCPIQRWREIEAVGADGQSGQQYADEIENAIVDKAHAQADTLRGVSGSRSGRDYFEITDVPKPLQIQE